MRVETRLSKGGSVNNCRECEWFDPAYDKCRFYGTVRADDLACMEFQLTDQETRID